jgi:hypothetical protein
VGVAVGVVLLGDYAEDWKAANGSGEDPGGGDWRYERDAWADGRMTTTGR